jgi:hypothetical protein
VREVKVHSPDSISTFEELPGGRCEARLFSRVGGIWRPPLPVDLELPAGFERNLLLRSEPVHSAHAIGRSSVSSRRSTRGSSERPAWLLGNDDEPRRL